MPKARRISLRIPESEYQKIKAMLNGRTMTKFFVDLIKLAVEKERDDANSFLQLMQKLGNSDLSKTSDKLDTVLETLTALGTAGKSKIDMEKIMRYLQRILTESAKARIEIEEYARRDFQPAVFELFKADVKVHFSKYVEDWKNQKGGE
jgi:hypothetical protein